MFVSYAQNFEDVMLWRALRHIERGFYIDVGACDPSTDSVTRAFYERGWRGINVEPDPNYYARLQAARPEDMNLCIAVGAERGRAGFYVVEERGLSTLDPTIAEMHQTRGFRVREQDVEILTLTEICQTYVEGPIHFLKVDVEGHEAAVLRGLDLMRYRPWIIVAEATLPNTQIPTKASWEPILIGADYDFVYADGLNRFYIAREHGELRQHFTFPPNFFDQFKLAALVEAEQRAAEAETRAAQAEAEQGMLLARLQMVEQDMAEAEAHAAHAQAEQGVLSAQLEATRHICQTVLPEAVQPLLSQFSELNDGLRQHVAAITRQHLNEVQRELESIMAERNMLAGQLEQGTAEREELVRRVEMAEAQVKEVTAQLQARSAQLQQAEQALRANQAWAHELNERVVAIYRSNSWRVTTPLRGVSILWRGTKRVVRQSGGYLSNSWRVTTPLRDVNILWRGAKRMVRQSGGYLFIALLKRLHHYGWLVPLSRRVRRIAPGLWRIAAQRFAHRIIHIPPPVIISPIVAPVTAPDPDEAATKTKTSLDQAVLQILTSRRTERGI
jgi:FkbM family methyltransferase